MGDLHAVQNSGKAQEWKQQLQELNPFHNNPTFEGSDGVVIGETSAILRYVANNSLGKYYPGGQGTSAPEDLKVRAMIDWAMDVVDAKMNDALGYGIVFPLFGFAAKPP